MGVSGKALTRASALGVCLALAACATPPRLSTSELEKRVDEQQARVTALDAEFVAFQKASAGPGPGNGVPGGAYYNSSGAKLTPLEPRHAQSIHQMLSTVLQQRGATRFEYVGRGGSKQFAAPWSQQSFDEVPLAVQYAATLAAQPAFRGAETDLRVPLVDGGVQLVTVWNDDGDRIEATDGADPALPPISAGVQADPLRARYGVGPIEGWSASELASLERALSLLSPQELAGISGLPFRRRSSAPADVPRPPPGLLPSEFKPCGLYRWQDGQRWIEIFDCAFDGDALSFVGRPDHPLPPSARVIVHEIGHALGKKATADLYDRILRENASAKELVDEFNRQGRRIPQDQMYRYQQMQAKFAAMSAVFARWSAVLATGASNSSPVIVEFDQVRARNGFTLYGRWNSDEAFAEAFSLYRADPDACRRISPQVFAFFEAGRHLSASP